ncbi:MAG: hypothetical protein O3A00_19780, partial [Planctomycetota bacterium]|nr:hypothetical protein [Planctomycetota bacterium]
MADSSRVPVDPGEFDPYHKWLGIPISEQPPNHYRLLGIELFEDDLDVIEAAGNRQSAFLRQLALGPHMQASQRLLNEMAKAQVCLLRPDRKAAYDEQLQATLQPAVAPDRAAVAPSRGQRTPVEDTAESATSAAERRPSFPKQVANWRKQGQAFLSRVPRKYRYAAGAGLGVCVLLLMVVAMWPEPVDPHGPAKVKVLVDDAFSKNFADKLVVYAIDETPYAIGTLQSGIVLEPGEHTLEVKVGEKPPAAKTDDKTPSPKSPAQDAKTVFTRKFMVVATEPPTLQLSFVDGKIA